MATVTDNSVEKIVRPFQVTAPINLFPRLIGRVILEGFSDASETEDFGGLAWGDGNDSQFNQKGVSGFKTSADRDQDETKRNTAVKRVTNPDDQSQFVDVEVIKDITFFEQQTQSYIKQNLNNGAGNPGVGIGGGDPSAGSGKIVNLPRQPDEP